MEENAILNFTDNPSDYLPAVMTSWKGLECYNYSPLLYAFECENVAITGKGTLQPKMDTWKVWFKRPQPHLETLKELYTKASTDIPVIERQMAVGENHLHPHLIHFNRCKNVLAPRKAKTINKQFNASIAITETPENIQIETRLISVFIPRHGDFLIDSLLYKGTKVGEKARLICNIQNEPIQENTS